jgi:hypothetical protein
VIKDGKDTFLVSFCVFKIEKRPAFLLSGSELDIIHHYAVIIEHKDFLAIIKSGAHDFYKVIASNLKLVDIQVLQNAFVQTNSMIEKAVTQSINPREGVVKKTTYEDKDLSKSMTTYGASEKVVKNFRLKNDKRRVTGIANKSRLNLLGEKGSIEAICNLVSFVFERFNDYKPSENFFSNFATLLNLDDYAGKVTPKDLLLLTTDIIGEAEEEDTLPKLYYSYNGEKRYAKKNLLEILENYADMIEITEEIEKKERKYYLKKSLDKTLQLVIRDSRFKFASGKFKNLFLEFEKDNVIKLQDYINNRQCFILTFDQSDIRYTDGQLCLDSKLLGKISSFLQIFKTNKELASIKSEKGSTKSSSTKFDDSSLFGFTEKIYANKVNHFILDDMGFESADYIGVDTNKKIQLFHCKSSIKGLSASAFQDVVGQALKNLSFFFHTTEVDKKSALWLRNYKKTKIPRLRHGNKKTFISELKTTLAAANFDREVYLVVNYISYKQLKEELEKLRDKKKANRQTNQILWLLSSLQVSCAEKNVKVFIVCKE